MENLLAMGLPEARCRRALDICQGDVETALELVLSGCLDGEAAAASASASRAPPAAPPAAGNGLPPGTRVVATAAISQYDFPHGRSACTAIACQAALRLLSAAGGDSALRAATAETVMSIVADGAAAFERVLAQRSFHAVAAGSEHASVQDIAAALPEFAALLRGGGGGGAAADAYGMDGGTIQGMVGSPNAFESVLSGLAQRAPAGAPLAVVITKPPESVLAVVRGTGGASGGSSGSGGGRAACCWLFDSHPRPAFGVGGAALLAFDGGAGALARYLHELFLPLQGGGSDLMVGVFNSFDATPLTLPQQPGGGSDGGGDGNGGGDDGGGSGDDVIVL